MQLTPITSCKCKSEHDQTQDLLEAMLVELGYARLSADTMVAIVGEMKPKLDECSATSHVGAMSNSMMFGLLLLFCVMLGVRRGSPM